MGASSFQPSSLSVQLDTALKLSLVSVVKPLKTSTLLEGSYKTQGNTQGNTRKYGGTTSQNLVLEPTLLGEIDSIRSFL